MTDADRIAELERKMDLIAKWVDPTRREYRASQLHRDLTTPPPKPRPKIEVVPVPVKYNESYFLLCGDCHWTGRAWSNCGGGYEYSMHDAEAIAAALTAAGNYPAEYQETSR